MPRHSKIPPAQRAELVLAVLRGTEKPEVLARRQQVSANTLRRWRDEFIAADQNHPSSVSLDPRADALGSRSGWYRHGTPAPPEENAASRSPRGPSPQRADDHERHVVQTVAKACPW